MSVPVLWLSAFVTAFYVLPIASVLQTAIAASLMVIALACGFIFTKTEYKFSPLTLLVLCLWGLAGVSALASDMKFVSIIYFFFFSAFPVTFLLFGTAGHQKVLWGLRVILLALGIAAMVQFFAMPDMLKFGGTHWPFADNNTLGALLAVGALMFLGNSLRGGKWQFANIACALVLFAGIMTTEGRAVMVAFTAVLAGFMLLLKPAQKKPIGIFLMGVAVLLVAIKQSDLSVWHWFGEGQETLTSFATQDADRPNALTGSRFMMWKSAALIFADHPFLGTGIGTFFLYYPEFRNPWDDSAGYMAHNDLIQFATEMGFLAPLLALGIVGFVVFTTLAKLKTLQDQDSRLNLLIPFSAFVLLAGHSLVNFNFYILPSLMIIGLMLAIWNKQIATNTVTIGQNRKLREVMLVFGVFVFLSPLWSLSLSEFKVAQSLDRLGQDDVIGFSESLNLAEKLGLGLNGRSYLQAAIFASATNDRPRALMFLERAEQVSPRITRIYSERSAIFAAEGDRLKALASAQLALKMDPSSVPVRMQVADLLELLDKKDESYAVLKDGMAGRMRSPDPRTYYGRVAITSIANGDFETNKDALERLKRYQRLDE